MSNNKYIDALDIDPVSIDDALTSQCNKCSAIVMDGSVWECLHEDSSNCPNDVLSEGGFEYDEELDFND